MSERVKADGQACLFCAARTPTSEGSVCEPWKLGQSNNTSRKSKRTVFGRNHKSGTALRPTNCPHPDSTVSTIQSAHVMLRHLLKK